MHQTLSENYGHNDHALKIREHTPPQDHNEEDLHIHSPCPSNWSDDLLEINQNKDKDRNGTKQPNNYIMTLMDTRVPQDVLAHIGTTLRQPQTVPQALQVQTQKMPKQKTRPPYKTWNWKKATKQDEQEKRKAEKYFIHRRDNIELIYIYMFAVPDCLT